MLTPLFRITVAWEVGNGKQAVKVYEAKSPQQAWQGDRTQPLKSQHINTTHKNHNLLSISPQAQPTFHVTFNRYPNPNANNIHNKTCSHFYLRPSNSIPPAAVLETVGLPMEMHPPPTTGASGSAGTMGFPINTGGSGGAGGGGDEDGMDQEQGEGEGQEPNLVGSEYFLDVPDKAAAAAARQQSSSSSSSSSSSAAAGTGGSGGVVADEDLYEEPDEEEITLRVQLVELRKAYFRALRHEQSMGYQSAVTPRLSLEVVDTIMDEGILRLVEGMEGVIDCRAYTFVDSRQGRKPAINPFVVHSRLNKTHPIIQPTYPPCPPNQRSLITRPGDEELRRGVSLVLKSLARMHFKTRNLDKILRRQNPPFRPLAHHHFANSQGTPLPSTTTQIHTLHSSPPHLPLPFSITYLTTYSSFTFSFISL